MMKNVVIFVLSPFSKIESRFTDSTGLFDSGETRQTNESSLRYLKWQLDKEGEVLDRAFVFVTSNLVKDGTFEKFQVFFPDLSITIVDLPSGEIDDAMGTVPIMHDKLVQYRDENVSDTVRINVDITGGFRHASMMMVSLIQLLKYSGFEIGEVLYANMYTEPKKVEMASDLLDFSSLIGGAEEFVTFGSIKQIRSYFKGAACPLRLQMLLEKMEVLSETLRLCGSYEITKDALLGLTTAIDIYERSIQQDKYINTKELYFSKLLPRIKNEYGTLLSEKNEITPMDIIRWCLHKGLVQQAVAFYTEWIPRFLIESKYVYVEENSIIEECIKKGNLWSHWAIYLLRSYQPNYVEQGLVDGDIKLNYGSLVPFFQTGDLSKVKTIITGHNDQLEKFLLGVEQFCKKCSPFLPYYDIVNLPKDDLIIKLLEWTRPVNTALDVYIQRRLDKEGSVEGVIIKALGMLPKDKVKFFFTMGEYETDESEEQKNKAKGRSDIFKYLLENNLITTKIQQDKLLGFVEKYATIVDELRNKFAHANADTGMVQDSIEIIDDIEKSLDLIKIK